MSKRSGPPYRVSRETLLPLLRDTSICSGTIARRFGYARHWITQLRRHHGIKGAPRGGDHKSAAFRAMRAAE